VVDKAFGMVLSRPLEFAKVGGHVFDLGVDERLKTKDKVNGIVLDRTQASAIANQVGDPLVPQALSANFKAAFGDVYDDESLAVFS